MNSVDRTFGWLLVIGSLLHAFGSYSAYNGRHEMLLWALSATLAGLLLAALNLLRIGRPGDRTLAWISFAGCLGWLAMVLAFGAVIHRMLDLRVVALTVIAVVLAIFSVRTALGKEPPEPV
jgi:hypothetical protein